MNSISRKIIDHARTLPEGEILSDRNFLHLGKQAVVDQEMSRLVEQKKLFRLSSGMFVLSYQTRFGIRGPSVNRIIEGIARMTGERITVSGATAANCLRLSKHVPMCDVFWTSGEDRIMNLGVSEIKFRHVPDWQLCAPNTKTGDAIRAFVHLGKLVTDQVFDEFKSRLDDEEQDELLNLSSNVPTWIAEKLSTLAAPAPAL